MNIAQITEGLNQYADEDIQILEENGVMAISDTLEGTLFLELENGVYDVRNSLGVLTLRTKDRSYLKAYLMETYDVQY